MQIDMATSTDIPTLCSLLKQLFAQETEFIPKKAVQQRGLKMIIENPEVGAILVARKDEEIIGMVNLLFTVSTALGERVVLLEDMVIDKDHRDLGIGTGLLRAAVTYAEKNSCRRITLLTDADNIDAQRFYIRHDFTFSPMMPLRRLLGSQSNT